MKRVFKYRKFRKEIQKIAKKLAAAETNPLGRNAIWNLRRYERQYDKLNEKWQNWISKRVENTIVAYYEPTAQGRNGEWYSAADMDDLMLRGS